MAAKWRVVPPQRFFDELTPAGTFEPTVEITFELVPSGSTGTVRIPRRSYSAESVREAIETLAQSMAEVEEL